MLRRSDVESRSEQSRAEQSDGRRHTDELGLCCDGRNGGHGIGAEESVLGSVAGCLGICRVGALR